MGGETNNQTLTRRTAAQNASDQVCCEPEVTHVLPVLGVLVIGGIVYLMCVASSSSNPRFQINSISVSPITVVAGGKINPETNFNINFTVKHPKSSNSDLIYDNSVLHLYYKKELILVSMLAPLHQEPLEENLVTVSVGSVSSFLENWVVSALVKGTGGAPAEGTGAPRGRAMTLGLKIESRVKYDPGKKSEKIKGIKVSCDQDVKIEFPSNGNVMAGEPVGCRVEMVTDF